jgi:hypothetical protein
MKTHGMKAHPTKVLLTSVAIVALYAIPQVAAQTGSAPFCLQTAGGARCVFGTMGECENARPSSSTGQCMSRTDANGTTGLGESPTRSPGTPTDPRSTTGR